MTAETLAAPIERLEDENARLVDLARDPVGAVQQLALLVNARPAEVDRLRLRVLEGGMS